MALFDILEFFHAAVFERRLAKCCFKNLRKISLLGISNLRCNFGNGKTGVNQCCFSSYHTKIMQIGREIFP